MATEFTALIRTCKAEPDDDAPRLILADWLDDHGEPERAAFIRRQILTPESAKVDQSSIHQWAETWEQLGEEIRSSRSAGAGLYSLEFQRGFLRIADGYEELYNRLGRILNPPFDWNWVEEIKFGSWHDGDWTPLFRSDRLLELTRLEFSDDDYHSILLEPLLKCPFLTSLRPLGLVMVTMEDDGFARLSECRGLAGLRSLSLTEMGLGLDAAQSLASSELWDELRSCEIRASRFGDQGLAELAAGRRRPFLERLDLMIGDYSDQGLIELARSDRFPALRELAVGYRTVLDRGGLFGGDGVRALLTSSTLTRAKITVSIMSEEPVPEGIGDLYPAYSPRLQIRFRNPRRSSGFQQWSPGVPTTDSTTIGR